MQPKVYAGKSGLIEAGKSAKLIQAEKPDIVPGKRHGNHCSHTASLGNSIQRAAKLGCPKNNSSKSRVRQRTSRIETAAARLDTL